MTINYYLDKDDFLNYQLYTASQSEHIKKKRLRGRIVLTLVYFLLALYSYSTDRTGLMIVACLVAVLGYFLYPLWDRKRYIRHYEQFIEAHRKERAGKKATLTFSDDFIYAVEGEMESKIPTTEIEEITEINTNIFMKLKSGQSLILSKNKIGELTALILFLKAFAEQRGINYLQEQNWKWR
ncbi:MAG: hypothetical protein JNM21_12695 [Taibaiella sp.]|nr:hypothetical protein [Taibaiella sp.]